MRTTLTPLAPNGSLALTLLWVLSCSSANKADPWPSGSVGEVTSEPAAENSPPRPTTTKAPKPVTNCSGDGTCMQYVSVGSRAEAWGIHVDHVILIANYCNAQRRCTPGAPWQWHEACLKQTVDEICGRVDCTQAIEDSQRWICLDHIDVGSCPELRENRDTILSCIDVPAPACQENDRRPEDRRPEEICGEVAEKLFRCDRSTMPSGCAYRQTEIAECLATERTEEEWNEIVHCVDDHHSCEDWYECLQSHGLQ